MEQLRGYQTLAFLFKRHMFWLGNVFQLFFLLAGFDNNQKPAAAETSTTFPATVLRFTTSWPTWTYCGGRLVAGRAK